MSRMIDLIRHSAVPSSLMRTAAHGALSLPAPEMLEILVYLSNHAVYSEQARLTLAAWDETSALKVLADPQTAPDVLNYFSAPANLRPQLLPALLENPAVPQLRLLELAENVSREVLEQMLASPRVRSSPSVLFALLSHAELRDDEIEDIKWELKRAGEIVADTPGRDILEPELTEYLLEHADEITAEEGKPFHLIGWTAEEQAEVGVAGTSETTAAARALAVAARAETRDRMSPVQRISRMMVGERVQLALKGSKDERFILIRDGAKVVSSAVLESPKLTDSEVEMFASMKNVSENVLRGISMKRKFMKSYPVKRILTSNPRCPVDVALPLVKELLVMDLRHLSINKNVSDTVRRFALKMFKDKVTKRD